MEEVTETITLEDLVTAIPEPTPTQIITIDELLNSIEFIKKKEDDDKVLLEGIGNMSYDELKSKLLTWASLGFPSMYEIYTVSITPPTQCSDGAVRSLNDYIVYCSGKTLTEHINLLNSKISGITLTFANMGAYIAILVFKKD